MYNLTLLCIMRDSAEYLGRCVEQINAAFDRFPNSHWIVTEGDSIDGTKDRLAALADPANDEVHGDMTVVQLDLSNVKWPGNADHPNRWRALEAAWNTCIKQIEPSRYVVCVESDLIWSADVLARMIAELEAGCGDVLAPMLMRDTPLSGRYFYDVHACVKDGVHFASLAPYHLALKDDERFMTMDTVGGMLVMRGDTMNGAEWREGCVLHFPPSVRVVLDTKAEIYHP